MPDMSYEASRQVGLFLMGARDLADQTAREGSLSDVEYDKVVETVLLGLDLLTRCAPYRLLKQRAQQTLSSAKELQRQ